MSNSLSFDRSAYLPSIGEQGVASKMTQVLEIPM